MTDKCILEAYRNMAVQSVIMAVRDFVYDVDDINKFRKYKECFYKICTITTC